MSQEFNYIRWRLILGKHAEQNDDFTLPPPQDQESKGNNEDNNEDDHEDASNNQQELQVEPISSKLQSKSSSKPKSKVDPIDLERALEFLYDREYEPKKNLEEFSKYNQKLIEELWSMEKSQRGGQFGTALMTVPAWISQVRELFPVEAQEIMTKDAIKRYNLQELITDPKVLEKTKPSLELTKLLITFKDSMQEDTLAIAKNLIAETVKELQDKLKREIINAIIGKRNRFSQSPLKISKNFDIKKTLDQNLKHYIPERNFFIPEKLYFNSRIHKKQEWNIIIVVDQSGSMLDSVIHSSIIASIFASVPALKTNLIIFDTEVYDYSHLLQEPLEVLMKVQLGGGTNIAKAVEYSMSFVQVPKRSILILITDFYEGYDHKRLVNAISTLHESGVKLLGLTAINYHGQPVYNKALAEKCSQHGMDILSVTPKKLADMVSQIIEG